MITLASRREMRGGIWFSEMRMYLYNGSMPLIDLFFDQMRREEEILCAPILCISYQSPSVPSISPSKLLSTA